MNKEITDQINQQLRKIFAVVAYKNKLKHVEDNMFVDEYGETYYLDKLGFHRSVVYSNHELRKKEDELQRLIERYNKVVDTEHPQKLLEARRKGIKKMLMQKKWPDHEKIRRVLEYLQNTEKEDV